MGQQWHIALMLAVAPICAVAAVDVDAGTDASASQSGYALPEIVVTAKNLQGSASLERKISAMQMRAWNAQTAAEVLVQTPGVNVQYGGSSGDARIWMRGFRDRDMLILFDGIPVASAFEGNIDLNEISTQAISEIRVVKSAPSVIYGPNGMGGVIDVVPQPAAWSAGFDVGAEFGAHDRKLFNSSYTGKQGNVTYRLAGSYNKRGSFELPDDFDPQTNQLDDSRTNADFRRRNLFGYVRMDETALGDTSLFYNLSKNERGLAPEVGVDDADYERLGRSDRSTIGFAHQFANAPISFKAFHNSYDSELEVYTDSSYQTLDEIESAEEDTAGAMLYASFSPLDGHTLVLGSSAIRERFESEGTLQNFDDARLRTYSVSVEDHFSVGRLNIIASGLYSRFEQPEVDRRLSVFNPQLVLRWSVADRIEVHASAAQRTRFPKLRELYQRRRGNPNLQEQQAENYQLGVVYQTSAGWQTDVTVFRSNVTDLIERPDRRSSYQNLSPVRFEGVEVSTGGQLNERLSARLSYTHLDAAESLPGGGDRQLRSRAKHSYHGELRLRINDRTRINVNGIYSSGLHDLDPDQMHVQLPSYLDLHIKAVRKFREGLEGYVSITNLTDKLYTHRLGYPRPGREIRLGMTYDF